MKAYFWHFVKLFKKQVFIALSSKVQNVNAGFHCNFMIFQWEPDLTFGQWSKNWNNGHLKQVPVAKNTGKCPQNGLNSSLKAWKWTPQDLPLMCDNFRLSLWHFDMQNWAELYNLSLLFETITILWNGLITHWIWYNGVKKGFQSIKQV